MAKKRKIQQPPGAPSAYTASTSAAPSASTSAADSAAAALTSFAAAVPTADDLIPLNFRSWADLPRDLLISIRNRLSLSIPELFAFSAVCRSWRSAAFTASSDTPFCGPPLLLTPIATPSPRRSLRWSGPPQCVLRTLPGDNAPRPYRSMISSKTLKKKCIGYSNGQLIFVGRKRGVLADVFTGQEVQPPDFPSSDRRFAFGILTAPLASELCLLLLVSFDVISNNFSNILFWQPGSTEWSKLEMRNAVAHGIISLGVVKDEIFVMDSLYNLIVVEFFRHIGWNHLGLTRPNGGRFCYCKLDQYLVECGGELLFVLFISSVKIEVHRLDRLRSVWVKVLFLEDWCLFIDVGRNFAISCPDPAKWGGRDNCIYFVRPGSDNLTVVPLDAGGIDTGRCSVLSAPRTRVFQWPSPIWVYPKTCEGHHFLSHQLIML